MSAIRAVISATPYYSVPVPQGLEPMARDWFMAHAQLEGDMVLLPGEALFAEAELADRFTADLGAAWAAGDDG